MHPAASRVRTFTLRLPREPRFTSRKTLNLRLPARQQPISSPLLQATSTLNRQIDNNDLCFPPVVEYLVCCLLHPSFLFLRLTLKLQASTLITRSSSIRADYHHPHRSSSELSILPSHCMPARICSLILQGCRRNSFIVKLQASSHEPPSQ